MSSMVCAVRTITCSRSSSSWCSSVFLLQNRNNLGVEQYLAGLSFDRHIHMDEHHIHYYQDLLHHLLGYILFHRFHYSNLHQVLVRHLRYHYLGYCVHNHLHLQNHQDDHHTVQQVVHFQIHLHHHRVLEHLFHSVL